MQRALIVEDIPEVAHSFAARLRSAFPGIAVRQAASLEAARAALEDHAPQIALLDIGLPDGDGTSLLVEGCLPAGCLKVMITIFDDDAHLFAALRAGADGYLLKDDTEEAGLAALRGIVSGQLPLSPSIARRILATFRVPHKEPDVPLAPREREVLSLIAKGCSVKHAAELLGVAPSTVASYLKAIYRKLQVSSRAEATLEAARLGLISIPAR